MFNSSAPDETQKPETNSPASINNLASREGQLGFFSDELQKPESILPANINDQASKEDWLGFVPYVTAIADFLTNRDTKPPLVLSVEGEWGSGKTSFMLQLQDALNQRGHDFTIWFNPWRHDKEEAVWAAFATQFVHGLANKQWFGRRWLGHIKLFVRRFRWEQGWLDLVRKIFLWIIILGITVAVGVAGYLNWGQWTKDLNDFATRVFDIKDMQSLFTDGIQVGGITAYVTLWLTLLSKVGTLIGDPLKIDLKKYVDAPNYEERVSFIERFHEDFKHIVQAYAGNQTVYVFIDDVDRCEVPKAADLMSALNLMISGDVRLVFIIGMDREKIAAGLAVKHEKLLPYLYVSRYGTSARTDNDNRLMGLEFGYDFIEKFVQLPFLLPRPDDIVLEQFLRKISGTNTAKLSGPRDLSRWFPSMFRRRTRGTQQATEIEPTFSAPSEAQKERRESIKIEAGVDSEHIHAIVKTVSPAFDNNPRRIKQFINLFRLRVFIAAETGLFDQKADTTPPTVLTLEQLGKFVAINLRWPLLMADLDTSPELLTNLQKLAIDPAAVIEPKSILLDRWSARKDLMSFLMVGINSPTVDRAVWSLELVGVTDLLRVLPRVRKVLPPEIRKQQPAATVPSSQKQDSSYVQTGQEVPITQVVSTYVLGDDLFDDSFSIDSASGEFLGEYGIGISEALGASSSPKQVCAFEMWLFDKNDIQTVTKIFASEYAYKDNEIHQRLNRKGEVLLIAPGTQVVLETETLQMVATIADMEYANSSIPSSHFERVSVEFAIFQKPALK
jgi:hypothetical protein